MPDSPWQKLINLAGPDQWGTPRLSTEVVYWLAGLNALAYVQPSEWQETVATWLDGPAITVNPGTPEWIPRTVVISDGSTCVVVVEGTKSIQQWYSYVTGAEVIPWLPDRGSVFAPFLQIYNAVAPRVLAQIPPRSQVLVSGQSLGGAVASLLASALQVRGQRGFLPAHFFACPVHGDLLYAKVFKSPAWVLSHPLDPVPLLPADCLTPMGIDVTRLLFGTALVVPGTSQWPWSVWPWQDPPIGARWVAAFASSASSDRLNAHNTYVYLRSIRPSLGAVGSQFFGPFDSLLQSLGLFDPWPR